MERWKGIRRGLTKDPDAPLELYDLSEDIGETNNIVTAHPEVAKQIEAVMRRERTAPAY